MIYAAKFSRGGTEYMGSETLARADGAVQPSREHHHTDLLRQDSHHTDSDFDSGFPTQSSRPTQRTSVHVPDDIIYYSQKFHLFPLGRSRSLQSDYTMSGQTNLACGRQTSSTIRRSYRSGLQRRSQSLLSYALPISITFGPGRDRYTARGIPTPATDQIRTFDHLPKASCAREAYGMRMPYALKHTDLPAIQVAAYESEKDAYQKLCQFGERSIMT
ncbi:hypothetical protein F5Y17DRAFT_27496 [Xylariaceae sp. FL0594]|nr:hypothetical protein F5Y17DRAFT_27496 [Xylariaceae sp. FL0594]